MDAVTILDFPTGYFFVIYLGYFANLGGHKEFLWSQRTLFNIEQSQWLASPN